MTSTRNLRRRLIFLFIIVVLSFAAFSYISTPPYMTSVWNSLTRKRLIWTSHMHSQLQPAQTSYVLLAVIYSLPEDAAMRRAVRQTWGQYLNTVSKSRLLFFVGRSGEESSSDKLLDEEKTFKDIIRLDLVDSFKNQTLRSIKIFQWIVDNRVKVQFLLRVEARAFVNVPKLVELLKGISAKRYMLGCVTKNTKPERNKNSPWYVSQDEYPIEEFPLYLQNFGYLMTGNLIKPILKADSLAKRFWIEDIYITGILAKKLYIVLIHSDRFTYSTPGNKCDYPKIIMCLCPSSYQAMKEVYQKVEMPDEEC